MIKEYRKFAAGVTLVLMLYQGVLTGCNQSVIIESKTTTPEAFWQKGPSVEIGSNTDESTDVEIFPEQKQQVIDGFGGCFNEMGWEQLQKLDAQQRDKVMGELFDPETGCKFNLCRMPIGANDYAMDWYSFDEQDGDFQMDYFSINRDKQRLIPYIKAAQKFAPNLLVWASPWCPPSWMKTNHHYACSPAQTNDLEPEQAGKEMQTQFRMEPKVLEAYALYFSKFVQAYTTEGIPITAVHVQNEPNSCQTFPSCVWRPEDLATFIGQYLGPRFEKDKLATDIFIGTVERPQLERVSAVLDDPEAKKYVKGVGFQWAGKDAIPEVHEKYPGMKLIQTETECGNGSNDWKAAEHTWDLILHYMNNGASAYMYWSMILDETGNSRWGWKQNAMITVNNQSREVSYNPEFYLMKHLSYFVAPGAVKLASSGEFNQLLAFENPDQSVTIATYNPKDLPDFVLIKIGNEKIKLSMKPKSFNSVRLRL